jgi:plastocyanin
MLARILPCALVLVLCAACGGDSAAPSNEVTIEMRDNSFSPASQPISAGTTVRWRNVGAVPHNTTSAAAGLWASDNLNPGGSFPRRFDTTGTFAYSCTLHAGMNGTIVVE